MLTDITLLVFEVFWENYKNYGPIWIVYLIEYLLINIVDFGMFYICPADCATIAVSNVTFFDCLSVFGATAS